MSEANDPRVALRELFKSLPPEQADKVFEAFMGLAEPKIEAVIRKEIESVISKALPSAIDQGLTRVGYTEEAAGLLHMLAARSKDNKEAVLQKALTLYGLALDAREKGNRLAIISPDDVFIPQVVFR